MLQNYMDVAELPSKFGDIIDDFFEHGPPAADLVALTTFASNSPAQLESDNISQFEHDSTNLLPLDSHRHGHSIKQSKTNVFSGWRLGACTAGCLAVVSLIINLAAAVYLARRGNAQTFLAEVYKGDCDRVQSLGLWIHLLINLISTLLLGGSNYCMQCLCAPSRDELDRAHAKGVPLEIGVPSPGNQFAVSKLKRSLWWILGLSSIPLHLMYNSAFYTSLGARDYNFYIVNPEFLNGHVTYNASLWPTSVVPPKTYYKYNETGRFRNLTNLECITAYAQVVSATRGTLLLVTSNSSGNYSVINASNYLHNMSIDPSRNEYRPYDWICADDPAVEHGACDENIAGLRSHAHQWKVLGQPIDYCLAEAIEQQCTINGNLPIVAVVLICNVVKGIVMMYVAFKLPGNPLITVGDAIQSFLDEPDPTTKGLCWATRRHILDYATYTYHFSHAPWPANTANAKTELQTISLQNQRWFKAPGYTRWVSFIVPSFLTLVTAFGLFAYGFLNVYQGWGSPKTQQSMEELGFGVLKPRTVIHMWSVDTPPAVQILASVLVANSPQLVLSFLYLNLNGLMTSMWLADEWHRFATQRKYLRVSSPKGKQRSTHFLQLPYKISIPLMISSGLLHWAVSQSLFLAVVSEYDPYGDLVTPTLIGSCGFSLLPLIVTIVLGIVVVLLTLGLGFRRYDGRIPLVGTCSAAISAACHRPDWDKDAALRPLQYGQPNSRRYAGDIGHGCFTSGTVDFIVEGKKYA